MTEADIIIIGAGPGGMELCAHALKEGHRVVIIERDLMGGTCLNRGCIPTKALCRSAEAVNTVRECAPLGVNVEGFTLSYPTAVNRKNEVVAPLRNNVEAMLSAATTVHGEAEFVSADTVKVGDELYRASKIVIATGSRPVALPIEGAELTIDSDKLLDMTELPANMTIIGGGVIGMEFACILSSFGVNVTVVEYCPEILPNFDREIGKRLRSLLSRKGIKIITGAAVTAIREGLEVVYQAKGKEQTVKADCVLMAVGRRAVVPKGAEEIGINVGRRGIEVDDNFMTSVPGVYAIGDVNGRMMLAHVAEAQARAIMGQPSDFNVVPGDVFTSPECSMVGLTEEQCQAQGLDFKVSKSLFRSNGKAMSMAEPDGFVKLITEAPSGKILGCHIIGAHAADLIQEVATAMAAGLPASALASTIHAHPTLSEVVASACRSAE